MPIDSLDLSLVSILYTQGDQAAITPNYNYNFQILHDTITISSWRQLLYWLGPPGERGTCPTLWTAGPAACCSRIRIAATLLRSQQPAHAAQRALEGQPAKHVMILMIPVLLICGKRGRGPQCCSAPHMAP